MTESVKPETFRVKKAIRLLFRQRDEQVLVLRLRSELPNDIAQSNAQSSGDFQKRINRDGPVGTFDLTDVHGMQIGFFSQFFLTETSLFAIGANVFTDQFAVSGASCHSVHQSRSAPEDAISWQAKLFSCHVWRGRRRTSSTASELYNERELLLASCTDVSIRHALFSPAEQWCHPWLVNIQN